MIATVKAEATLATSVESTPTALLLHLQSGEDISIPWENCSGKLANATAIQRHHLELSPGGYGIHWPLLDEDLSVQGLVNHFQQS
ncbi:MAG: DUF2442 domain-containing protein [Gemmatales bacterium]